MAYSVDTWYRIIERVKASGKKKFYPQVSNKESIWFERIWNYYRGGIMGDENLSFNTKKEAQDFINEVKGSKIIKTKIHYI